MAKNKQISRTQEKINYTKRLFKEFTNKQVGQSFSTMHKILANINSDLDSPNFEDKKLATDAAFKLMTYILPRESNGSQMNVQINNNNLEGGTDKVIMTISEFLTTQAAAIVKVKERTETKNQIRMKQIKTIEKDGE